MKVKGPSNEIIIFFIQNYLVKIIVKNTMLNCLWNLREKKAYYSSVCINNKVNEYSL